MFINCSECTILLGMVIMGEAMPVWEQDIHGKSAVFLQIWCESKARLKKKKVLISQILELKEKVEKYIQILLKMMAKQASQIKN